MRSLARIAAALVLAAAPALAETGQEHYEKAAELIQARKFADAKKELEACVKLEPGHVDARRVLAELLKKDGKPEAAAKHLQAAVEVEPESGKIWNELANCWADAAVAAARESVTSTKKRDDCAQKAIDAYRKVREKDPEFLPPLYNIGTMLCLMEKFADAVPVLEEYTQKKPEDKAGFFNYATACDKGGAPPEKTIAAWEAFIALAKDDPKAKGDVAAAQKRIKALKKGGK